MSWKIEIKPSAEKQYLSFESTNRKKIKESLKELIKCRHPRFHKDVRMLSGKLKGDYRMRVGNVRILFCIESETVYVYAILFRKDAYK